jgi:DNA-binding SARP family transcriptional activator
MGFSIGIIGPLCVRDGDRQVSLAAGNQRIVLASLVVRANRAVSLDELVNFVWGEHPPRSAAATLRNYVKRLRGVLGQAAADRIATRNGGYLIRLDTSELDATLFESLCRLGGAAIRDGDWPAAHDTLSHALSIWCGVPLLDVPSQVLRDEVVPPLERQRLLAIEDRIEADLSLGRHDRLVPELESLVAAHPLRERFHGQLMLALAGAGRRAEALVAYQRIRRELVGELGSNPGRRYRTCTAGSWSAIRGWPCHDRRHGIRRSAAPGYHPCHHASYRRRCGISPGGAGNFRPSPTCWPRPAGARTWSSARSVVLLGSGRPRWPCIGPVGTPTAFPTGSCT